jgi:hypothetical protein
MMDEKIAKAIVSSPLGGLEITTENGAVTALNWVYEEPTTPVNSYPLADATAELHAYFARDLKDFTVACLPAADAFERAV